MGRPAKNREKWPPPADRAPEAEAALCRLMADYLDGRLDAFDGVYAALAGRIRGYLYTLCRDASLADDLVQDTFMQIHRSRRTYEPGRPVTPWVFAIARHVFLMQRRTAGRRQRFADALAADALHTDRPRDEAAAVIDRDEVRRTLRQVPPEQRQAVLMHHVEGRSFAEIAARLGIRVNAAKTRAFRGMKKMRETMKGSPD
ncbi:MAG TPA: RNA polymerase sigma factor [Vicinamibacterales bacterium]|nr:RNA polymerase sigma factor [Vicinamibacterales bacterium]